MEAWRPSKWWVAWALLVLTAAGLWVGVIVVPRERARFIRRWHDQLSAMADDRRSAVEQWVAERLSEARLVAGFPVVASVVDDSVASGASRSGEDRRAHLDAVLRLVMAQGGYFDAVVLAADGRPVEGVGEEHEPDSADVELARQCVGTGLPLTIFDLRRGIKPVVHFVAPVFGSASARPVGALLLTAEPETWLYPFLGHQPVPTDTGETVLVQQEGDAAVFLTPLRHSAAKPLMLRRPLSTPEFVAAAALHGQEEFREFVDYRGVTVLASARRIRGTPWGLIAKVDLTEALALYRRWLAGALAVFAAVILAVGGLGYGLWNRDRLLVREAATINERRLAELVNAADNAVLVLSTEGKVLQANRRAEELYGFSLEELLGVTAADLHCPEAREDFQAALLRAVEGDSVVVETVHYRRDGSKFPVEVSIHRADVQGNRFLLETVRDITAHKAAEARIRLLNRLLRTISEINQLIVRERDRDQLLREACRILVEHGEFRMAWVGFADKTTGTVVPAASAGFEDGYLRSIGIRFDDTPLGRGPTGTAIRESRAVVVNDWETDERLAPWREAARQRGYRSSAAVPVLVDGRAAGALTVYGSERNTFDAGVTALLGELANDVAFALNAMDVAARREASERALRASEERYRLIVTSTSDGIFSLDLDGRITFATPHWMEKGGYTEAEVIGRRMTDFVPEDSRAEAWENFPRSLRDEDIPIFETELLVSDGTRLPVEISMSNLTDTGGKVIGRIGVFRDIAERKLGETALRESEERYRLLVVHSLDAVLLTAPDGRIFSANEAACRIFGRTEQEICELGRNGIIDQTDPRLGPALETRAQTGSFRGELTGLRRDGTKFAIEVSTAVFEDRAGSTRTAMIIRDISERRRAEEALRRSEAGFRNLFERANDAIVVFEPGSETILDANANACQIYGFSHDELVGMSMKTLTKDVGRGEEAIRRVVAAGTYRDLESVHLARDGREIHFLINASLIEYEGRPAILSLNRDITDRKKADEALRESERRFRTLTEEAPVPILVTRKGVTLEGNSKAAEMLRLEAAADFAGRPATDWFAPQCREESIERSHRRAGGLPVPSDFESVGLRATGEQFPMHVTVAQVVLADGPANVAFLTDITERKKGENALRESEARYRNLFEQSPLGIYQTTPEGKIMAANPALLEKLGYSSFEEVASRNLEVDGYEPHYPRREFKELIERDGEVIAFESAWLRRDGTVLSVRESARAVRDLNGQTLYYEGTIEDVTAQQRAEEERQRLVAAVEQASETIVITDPEGRIEYVNPAFEQTTGYTREEALGKRPSLLKSGRQDDRYYAAMWQTIARGETWNGHFVNQRKDGSVYEEEATISPIRDSRGTIVNFVAVKRNVTHEVALEEQLRQSQKMEAVGSLAGGVAHDFNNLLQALLSQTQLLQACAHDPERVKALGLELSQQISHGASLTRQLLLFSRRETTKPEHLDLNDVLRDATKMVRRLVRANIGLEIDLASKPLPLTADRGQLEQVLVNLAVNASDAMPEGGKLTIRTGALGGGRVWLNVEDTGTGIPKSVSDRIFEPFFTTKGAGKGTGLGLSVVHGIVIRHGGTIEVESEVGRGATFTVILPKGGSGEFVAVKGVPEAAPDLPGGQGRGFWW